LEAEKIIMIVTPKYLEICNLQQTKANEEKKRSHNDELVCNEIALIKNKLIEKGMAADKCIVILIDTKRKDLPHWMSQFNCYQYKNGKLSEGILPMLKPVISLNTLL
jgi:imidazole glycerol phosphate synthase subunit HisF